MLKRAIADPEVKAIVADLRRRTFIAGADITELASRRASRSGEALVLMENSPSRSLPHSPGTALGGASRSRWHAQFRVATKEARLGLPK